MRTDLAALMLTLALTPFAVARAQTQPPTPTCDAPEYRALDFWVGEWDAYRSGSDTLVGRSSITHEEAGCVIHEQWIGGNGSTGQSFNIFERMTGQWEQYWVSSTGEITHYIGGPTEDGMQLTAAGDRTAIAPGAVFFSRVTLTAQPDGSVRQVGETSGDGQSWTQRYDITYRSRAD